MNLPDDLNVFFWDIELDKLDLHKHRHFIISRILNEGNDQALGWLCDVYDREIIKNAVKAARGLSLKTARNI